VFVNAAYRHVFDGCRLSWIEMGLPLARLSLTDAVEDLPDSMDSAMGELKISLSKFSFGSMDGCVEHI
jgi:hypothetical protein